MNQECMADPVFTFAFQPIVNALTCNFVTYEALTQGIQNDDASEILSKIPVDSVCLFDQVARVQAISLTAHPEITCNLNLNFFPLSLYASAESILTTIQAAENNHLPIHSIVLEVVEGEVIEDKGRFADLINEPRLLGIKGEIDDFGAGCSGLNPLANFQPDQIELDMCLIHGIEGHGPRQSIVRGILQACRDLEIGVIAEGVETVGEFMWLLNAAAELFQGCLFAKPAFQSFPTVQFPDFEDYVFPANSVLPDVC